MNIPMLPRPRVRPLVFGLATLATLITVGCGGSDAPVAPPPAVTVSIAPNSTTVDAGGTASFTATVANAANAGVTWSASGGTIAGSGSGATWTAPFSGGPFTITATSVSDPARSASATVTVRPVAVSVSPDSVTVLSGETASFTASVANSANSAVTWNASGGTIVGGAASATIQWLAPVGGGSYTLTARSVADTSRSATATVAVAPVMVSVAGDSSPVPAAGRRPIVATVSGATDSSVVWTASGGTVIGTGSSVEWQAPVQGGSYTVTATSALDSTVSASITLLVQSIAVSVTPASDSLFRGESAQFTAQVTGAAPGRDSVQWTSSCGSIVATGADVTYTAPAAPGECVLTATSTLDTARSASATITVRPELLVTSGDDNTDGSCTFAHCSLREAILEANAAPNADRVLFSVGTVTLAGTLPSIVAPVELHGPGAAALTIDAAAGTAGVRRLLRIAGAVEVTVSDLTLTGGRDTVAGAILADSGATVTLNQVTVRGNQSFGGPGGGVVVFGGSTLTAESSIFENNVSSGPLGGGGGIAAGGGSTVTVRGGAIRGNEARSDFGGGVGISDASVTLENVTVENNSTTEAGGGAAIWDKGTLVITGGSVRNNVAANFGGALIAGAPTTAAASRVAVVMQNVRVERNAAGFQGGALQLTRNATVVLTKVVLHDNRITGEPTFARPTYGGAVFGGNAVSMTMVESTVSDNRILATSSVNEIDGGAGVMFLTDGSGSFATITNSTVSGNVSPVRGGGVFIGGTSTGIITNSTISGNSAPTAAGVLAAGTTVLRSSSVVGNSATVLAAGLGAAPGILAQVENTLFAGNLVNVTPGNCGTVGTGAITSLGSNLSDDGSCTSFTVVGDLPNTAAGVAAALADNGGTTRTHALLAGSAAIDAGKAASCPAMDQRGVARVGVCDIGAVEFVPAAPRAGAMGARPALEGRLNAQHQVAAPVRRSARHVPRGWRIGGDAAGERRISPAVNAGGQRVGTP